MSLFLFCLTGLYNTLRLQESDWSKHLSSCLYFMACFCFWHYPWNVELRCCSQQTWPPFCFFVTVFQGTCPSFLISTFRTNFVFLRSKEFHVFALFGINWHAQCQSECRNFGMYIIIWDTFSLPAESHIWWMTDVNQFYGLPIGYQTSCLSAWTAVCDLPLATLWKLWSPYFGLPSRKVSLMQPVSWVRKASFNCKMLFESWCVHSLISSMTVFYCRERGQYRHMVGVIPSAQASLNLWSFGAFSKSVNMGSLSFFAHPRPHLQI